MERQYALWLGWVHRTEQGALLLPPVERATPTRIRAWLGSMDNLAPATLLGYAGAVVRFCRHSAEDRDWATLQAILAELHRASKLRGSLRKTGRILSSSALFDAGARLVQENSGPSTHRDQAVRLRDGAIMCLLALMPMRRRALSELSLGTSLLVERSQMSIFLDGSMTKNGQPWEAPVPDVLREILTVYLEKGRSVLLARGPGDHVALWLGREGRPLGINQFTRAISNRTSDMFGAAISPHLFRDAAATTLARTDAAAARLIKPILGHATERIAEEHYIRADTIEAGRKLADAIERLRKNA
jgi:integrase